MTGLRVTQAQWDAQRTLFISVASTGIPVTVVDEAGEVVSHHVTPRDVQPCGWDLAVEVERLRAEVVRLERLLWVAIDPLPASPEDEALFEAWLTEQREVACNTCVHADRRFNSGHGATTCNLLDGRVVATGNIPTTRPTGCPRGDR